MRGAQPPREHEMLSEAFWRFRSEPAAFGREALVFPAWGGDAAALSPLSPGCGGAGGVAPSAAPVSADACWCPGQPGRLDRIPAGERSGAVSRISSWPRHCSVGSTASGPVMRAANVLSPCFAMKGPSTPGAQRSKASPNLSLFKPARLFLDVYRVLGGAGRADRGLATLCLGGFRSPGGPAACREWPGPLPRAAGAFPGLIFHH